MFDTKYIVEGVSRREFISKNTGDNVVGFKIFLCYVSPLDGMTCHCDVWVHEKMFNSNPIDYGDTLQIAFSPSRGKLLAYNILERSTQND